MGLLDDAIREHLELKRKHGADPTEVARQEREALGSGRVPPAQDAGAAADAAVLPDAGGALNAEAAEHGEAPPAYEPPFTDAIPEPPVAEDPAPAGAPDEDVLEETPEFLQETPEHERLWFEQRPPRDFDF